MAHSRRDGVMSSAGRLVASARGGSTVVTEPSSRVDDAPIDVVPIGEVPVELVPVEGVDQIEVSSGAGASWSNTVRLALPDVHQLLVNGLPPEKRSGLRRVTSSDGNYWSLDLRSSPGEKLPPQKPSASS